MNYNPFHFFVAVICFAFVTFLPILGQTGPGGVGCEDGPEENQPWNVLWLKADALDYENGDIVGTWEDQSGNGNDGTEKALCSTKT